MNKLDVSIEFSFDIDAGTIELFDDIKLHTNRLVHPGVFFKRYQNYKMDLKDKAYIDTTAQQVLKSWRLLLKMLSTKTVVVYATHAPNSQLILTM